MGKMITTRDIDASEDDSRKKLKQKTTKDINVKHLGQDEPLVGPSGPTITTHNIEEHQAKIAAQERMAKAREAKKKGSGKKIVEQIEKVADKIVTDIRGEPEKEK